MKRNAIQAVIVCLGLFAAADDLVAAATLTTLHTFTGADGIAPEAGLCIGTNGNFYGTTVNGGTGTNCVDGCGTVFEISSSGAFLSRYSFNEDDGEAPRAGLLQASDGNLYGTTFSGGPFGGLGNVFRITPTGVLTNLHTFRGNDGLGPEGTLIEGQNGILYGTTAGGGVISLGTVFQITTNGAFDSLNANISNGLNQPAAGVMLASDGNLYGTSEAGGSSTNCASGCGAVYRITTDGLVTNLHSFDKSDGQQPTCVLVERNGVLYGTTSGSPLGALNCNNGCGTVFSITTNGEFTTLHTFAGPEGKLPKAGLVFGNDGNLYGTTSSGGSVFQAGTVFQITTNGVYTKLISFAGSNGGAPVAPLILGPDGAFYGTTEVGGGTNGAGLGTVFKLTLSTNSSATSCVLSPALATNGVGVAHTVTATVTSNGVAKAGVSVSFNVISGPNVGQSGSSNTVANGQAVFTYTSNGTAGNDIIRAVSLGATGTATKVWVNFPTGDVNGDAHVTGADSLLINQVVVGLRSNTHPVFAVAGFANGDINTNNAVNGADSLLLNQVLVGLRSYVTSEILPGSHSSSQTTAVTIFGIGFPTNGTVTAVNLGAPVNLTLSNVVVLSREKITAVVPACGVLGTGAVHVITTQTNGVVSFGQFINQ